MQRRSRHLAKRDHSKPDVDIQNTARDRAILTAFNTYRDLPLNWLFHVTEDGGSYAGFRERCNLLCDLGLLTKYTSDGKKNNRQTQNFTRLYCGQPKPRPACSCGNHALKNRGLPVHQDYNPALPEEQRLIDLCLAQVHLGTRGTDVEFHPWLDIRDHKKTPPLPPHPFRFDYNESYVSFDGYPFYLKRGNNSLLFIKEVVRTNKTENVIKYKLKAYREIENDIKARYNFKSLMLLFIATSTTDRDNIVNCIKDIFPNGCKWISVSSVTDPEHDPPSTISITTHLFDEPFLRAGHRPFSLKTLDASEA
jgi:hypothetical protein